MKVRALKSFGGSTSEGRFHVAAGDVFELPEGVDWLQAGLVQVVEDGEKAVLPDPQPRPTTAEPVTVIYGIGPSTAQSMAELGIETVADLAAADNLPAEYERWQEAARAWLR